MFEKPTISHLVLETPEIVLDNYLLEAGKMLGGIIKHLESHKWAKALYCQTRRIPGEEGVRVGFVFLQRVETENGKPKPSNGYRMFEAFTSDENLANIFLTHMCQAVALAGSNATNMPWNCAPLTTNFYAIAPTKVIERFAPPKPMDE